MDQAINPRWAALRELPNHPEMSVFPDRPPRIRHQDAGDEYQFDCPQCQYNLTGIPGTYCPECGTDLEYEPVTVFTAADLSLVWAAAMVMDQNQVTNMIVMGSFDPVLIGLFTGRSSRPHLVVPFKFVHEAAALLEAAFGGRDFPGGQQPPPVPEAPDWPCPHCGEDNPGTFELCWRCQEDRPTT